MGTVVFNGKSSRDFGLEVETFPTYEIPERNYELVEVLGRNGSIAFDHNSYKNTPRSYKVSLATYDEASYSIVMNQISEWLRSSSGYARLEDTYDEDFYRLALYKDRTSIENLFNEAGRATLNFECKPQRFYKSGEFPIEFTSSGKIQNETKFAAKPRIQVTLSQAQTHSTVTIGQYGFTILANSGTSITIDSELQDAFDGVTNKNNSVSFVDREFPLLLPGLSNISFNGSITKLEITPRWYTI